MGTNKNLRAAQIPDTARLQSLSEKDARIFLKVLDSKEQPNSALRKAAAWYKENYEHGSSLAD
jgi:uncharacterized protein (DUF1778 family)